ncbi:hypothetical protein EXN66_Car011341 [Channa argus]|uniref:Uncharacterized protein n=1 Tax=Channa argus TaxID=215402 RepID=A0A6G1PZG8_CHAAH|nr:hypothetical protein EXN66_Car011341 [Channa argus]
MDFFLVTSYPRGPLLTVEDKRQLEVWYSFTLPKRALGTSPTKLQTPLCGTCANGPQSAD